MESSLAARHSALTNGDSRKTYRGDPTYVTPNPPKTVHHTRPCSFSLSSGHQSNVKSTHGRAKLHDRNRGESSRSVRAARWEIGPRRAYADNSPARTTDRKTLGREPRHIILRPMGPRGCYPGRAGPTTSHNADTYGFTTVYYVTGILPKNSSICGEGRLVRSTVLARACRDKTSVSRLVHKKDEMISFFSSKKMWNWRRGVFSNWFWNGRWRKTRRFLKCSSRSGFGTMMGVHFGRCQLIAWFGSYCKFWPLILEKKPAFTVETVRSVRSPLWMESQRKS